MFQEIRAFDILRFYLCSILALQGVLADLLDSWWEHQMQPFVELYSDVAL